MKKLLLAASILISFNTILFAGPLSDFEEIAANPESSSYYDANANDVKSVLSDLLDEGMSIASIKAKRFVEHFTCSAMKDMKGMKDSFTWKQESIDDIFTKINSEEAATDSWMPAFVLLEGAMAVYPSIMIFKEHSQSCGMEPFFKLSSSDLENNKNYLINRILGNYKTSEGKNKAVVVIAAFNYYVNELATGNSDAYKEVRAVCEASYDNTHCAYTL
jgi:hypothetical protein